MIKSISLTIDLEEFSLPLDYGKNITVQEMLDISYRGYVILKKILDKSKIKTTFFTTVFFAMNYPKIINILSGEGHEIALHSSSNDIKQLIKEKKYLEKISKSKIIGFRAHRFQIPNFKNLKKIGIKYDSSINPTYVPGRYNNIKYPRNQFMVDKIVEIPITTIPLFRIPFSFIWFRNFGLTYSEICTRIVWTDNINLYFHPWEFTDLDSLDISYFIKKNTGKKMSKMMKEYIKWCLSKNINFITLKQYVNSIWKKKKH